MVFKVKISLTLQECRERLEADLEMESRSQRGEQKSQEQHVLFSRTQVDMGEAPERYKSSVS